MSINITGNVALRNSINRDGFGLSEFFSIYAINYCEGEFIPDFEDEDAKITSCGTPRLGRKFDIRKQVENAIDDLSDRLNMTLDSNLDWPSDIASAFDYVDSATAAMFAFMITGVLFLFLAAIFGLISAFIDRRIVNILLVTFSILALVGLGISAAIVTTIITTVVGGINREGDEIGITADQGDHYLATTWASVALLFISTVVASLQLCTPRQSRPAASTQRKRAERSRARGSDSEPMLGAQMAMPAVMPAPMQMPAQMPMQMPMAPQMPYQYMPAMGSQYNMGYYGEPYAPQGWHMGGRMGW